MKRNRAIASLLMVASLSGLAGCGTRNLPAVLAGGSVIEGTGLDSNRSGSGIKPLSAAPDPKITVLALDGVARAQSPLRVGDRFSSQMSFDLRDGSARLGLPGNLNLHITGPARLQFRALDGLVYPLIESGTIEASHSGRIATPSIAALECDGDFRIVRSAQITTFHCARGSLRWAKDGNLVALQDARTWVVDEAQRRVTPQ